MDTKHVTDLSPNISLTYKRTRYRRFLSEWSGFAIGCETKEADEARLDSLAAISHEEPPGKKSADGKKKNPVKVGAAA